MPYQINIWEQIEERKKAESETFRKETLEKTIAALELVLPDFTIAEAYITGSILIPNKFGSNSDIDIAVSGLPDNDYFRFVACLGELLPRDIEVIELENCRFAEKILRTGMKIK
jgi:predicted nucleotidyltransferase